ncbi:MAG: A/G-specific adenine glycosylase [Vicinamibacteria bacterium]
MTMLHGPLLDWYGRNRRAMPWRGTKDRYRIWVSEVMLQQTSVKTATPYYEAFVERFPNVVSLAGAQEEEVLALWSGLGYYHRARNLHRGARYLVGRHRGHFPRTLEAALAVPGVGLYTASAVLSIAYGAALPVVDGNVRRVLARLLALQGPEWRSDAPYYNRADELLDRDEPGDWNQAVMELGATICTPRKPACPVCPLRSQCKARARGLQEQLPEPKTRREPEDVTVAGALVQRKGRVLLVRRDAGRLMGRMWEVPQTSLESRGLRDLAREMRERHGLRLVPGALVVEARHSITFRRIRVEGYRARLEGDLPPDPERFRWVGPADLAALPISSLTRKLLRGLESGQMPLALP